VFAAGEAPLRSTALGGSIDVRWLGGGAAYGWPGVAARLGEQPLRAIRALAFPLRAAFSSRGFDRVVAHWIIPSAFPSAIFATPDLEIWAHGADVRALSRAPRFARAVISVLLRRGAHFVFVARSLRDALVEVLGRELGRMLAQRSRVEPAPIDVPDRATLSDPRGDREPRVSGRFVVWVGRFLDAKRPLLAAELARHAGVQIVFIGDGPLALPAGALALGKLSRDETLRFIAHASALVSTSVEEGCPTVVREAQALGTPVIAFAAGDLAERSRKDPKITIVEDERAFVAALRALGR